MPPSLQNIFKEILQTKKLQSNKLKGDLSAWVSQGVFLLNTILTVRDSEPLSHQNFGWQNLIQNTLIYLDATPRCILLWGKNASFYKKNFTNPNHLILETSHPSPFSVYRGFAGCGHFKKANQWLKKNKQKPIRWIE